MEFKIGDEVKIENVTELNTGIPQKELNEMKPYIHIITNYSSEERSYELDNKYYFFKEQLVKRRCK